MKRYIIMEVSHLLIFVFLIYLAIFVLAQIFPVFPVNSANIEVKPTPDNSYWQNVTIEKVEVITPDKGIIAGWLKVGTINGDYYIPLYQ